MEEADVETSLDFRGALDLQVRVTRARENECGKLRAAALNHSRAEERVTLTEAGTLTCLTPACAEAKLAHEGLREEFLARYNPRSIHRRIVRQTGNVAQQATVVV